MDMSEDRKECHMCENFNKCNEKIYYGNGYKIFYGSGYCVAKRIQIEEQRKRLGRTLQLKQSIQL